MPYVREMDLWNHYFDEIVVVAPRVEGTPSPVFSPYAKNIKLVEIPVFDVTSFSQVPKALWGTLYTFFTLLWQMAQADHIHTRCPGNIGLIGVIAQLFFPFKKKTAKYAGNWDWNSKQPFTYRIQQYILRSTWLTHRSKTLVYGEWPDRNKNIHPFFTASYREAEKEEVEKMDFSNGVNLCFIGRIDENKSPLLSLEVTKKLHELGINAHMTFCGDGPMYEELKDAVQESGISEQVTLAGSVDAAYVKKVLQESHFLVFVSKSEGWPKVVAEAMFWGCVPLTSNVSCVPFMVGSNGERGLLLEQNPVWIADKIMELVHQEDLFKKMSNHAMEWSRTYTLEKFQMEIAKLVK